ncbi:MAG TPA: cell wall hydrolase [Bacillota bacterium]|nr:cell wall hydrolase [Bacillota bacterium]
MPKKLIAAFTLFLFALVGIHTPVLAEVQLGLEARLIDQQLVPDAVNMNWWFTPHLALRGNYAWNNDVLGLAALYNINPRSPVSLYLGLGENDVLGKAPDIAPEEKATLITGLELNPSPGRSGFSVMVEAQIKAQDLLEPSGTATDLAPEVGLSLNYLFPPDRNSAANAAEEDQNVELLAKVVTLEGPDEPFEGQVAVAAVALNRTRSDEYPHSLREVIYQPGQFKPAHKVGQTTPSASSLKAAKAALGGSDPSNGALYFYNPITCSAKARAFFKKHQVTARIGNHVFLK